MQLFKISWLLFTKLLLSLAIHKTSFHLYHVFFMVAHLVQYSSCYNQREILISRETILYSDKISRPNVFCKKGVLRFFLIQLQAKRLWHRCFPVNFEKFLRTPSLTEHLQWLLLFWGSFIFTEFVFILKIYIFKELFLCSVNFLLLFK